jgi:Na+-transporting NADH:ubiquinone oxidoreductase subunit F
VEEGKKQMLDIVLGVAFFTGIVLSLVVVILITRASLIPASGACIRVNDRKTLRTPVGVRLLAALDDAGIRLLSACGGKGICGQCKVQVLSGRSVASPAERDRLNLRETSGGMRLACQLTIHEDLVIRVPDEVFGVRRWRCRLRSSRCVGTLMKEIVLELPPGESIDFRAGAYIQVSCPAFHLKYENLQIDARFHEEWDRLGLWRLEDAWQGDIGFIHQVLHDRYLAGHPAPEDCEYYLCGPPVMIAAVIDLLDSLGVDPQSIRFDDFGG